MVLGMALFPCTIGCIIDRVKKLRGGGAAGAVAERQVRLNGGGGANVARDLAINELGPLPRPQPQLPWSASEGNELIVNGVDSLRFEVATFGPSSGMLSEAVPVLPGIPPPAPYELAGSILALRRRGNYDHSFLDTIRAAQDAGAVGCI
eukprot:COSAG02_NODE_9518_length_2190_cov_1.653276_1_plen_148_part_10